MAFIKRSTPSTTSGERQPETPRSFEELIQQLDSPDPAARRWAARDLEGHANATSALLLRLHCETEVSVREVILTALVRLADPGATLGLVSCLRSEDANLRNEAIEAMKALPLEVAPVMRGLLGDPDPDVRIFAINILESLRHPDVETWLIEVIEHDAVTNVCGTAVDLLSEVGSPASHDALQRLKARFASEPYIQFATALALKRIAPG